ncbi:glycosyltransferase family 4 protein [Candidatus Riflebacteria bacterium]
MSKNCRRKKIRIIQILEGIGWSGGQQQALFLTEGMQRMGYACILCCNPKSRLFEEANKKNLQPFPFTISKDGDLRSYLQFLKLLRKFKPNIINAHRSYAYTLMLLAAYRYPGINIILTRRVLTPPAKNFFSKIKYTSARIDGYIAVSDGVKKVLGENGVDSNRIRIIHSATDLKRFQKITGDQIKSLKTSLNIPDKAKVISLIGNYSDYKGQDFFLDIIAECEKKPNPYIYLFVGRDTDSEDFRKKIINHPGFDSIRLLGFRTDIPEILSLSTITLNTSKFEGFAGTLRESLALGVPAIVTDVGGNPEIIENQKQGFVHPYGDTKNFALSIHTLLSQEKLLKKFSIEALKKSSDFGVQTMIEKTLAFYHSFPRRRGR